MQKALIIIFSVLGGLVALSILIAMICFFMAFYASPRKKRNDDDEINFTFPLGGIYEPFRESMVGWINQYRTFEHRDFEIKSHDGLTLRGRYFECQAGAPIEILFNGYRGDAERDMSGAIERCFAMNRNALIVNQRATGISDGRVVTFGAKERLDAKKWAEFVASEFGSEVPIILSGVSMGATTVLLASALELPKNVVCILADCPYSTAEKIIKAVIKRDMHLPAKLLYPFVCLGARLFGGFKLSDANAQDAVKRSKLPTIFIHGDNDTFVPCEMSTELYNAKEGKKKLVFIKGAGHGLAFPVDKELYINSIIDFESEWKSK